MNVDRNEDAQQNNILLLLECTAQSKVNVNNGKCYI